jgi:lysophospholipase L1-like esterase
VTAAVRFAVLGDSVSEGVGDPLPGGGWRGWAALLAEGLTAEPDGTRLLDLARGGARSVDVAGPQLEAALQHRPHLASVLVGGNDTLRGCFDIQPVAAELHAVPGALRAGGSEVLTACLPDPGTVLGLPWPLARPPGRPAARAPDARAQRHRARPVNTPRAHHIDAAEHHWAALPGALSADWPHPSETGHRLLARDFHVLLSTAGLARGPAPGPDPDGAPPGRAASVWWMATRGTQWIADRRTDLLPDLLRLAAAGLRHQRHGSTAVLAEDARRATVAAPAALKGAPARRHNRRTRWHNRRAQQSTRSVSRC